MNRPYHKYNIHKTTAVFENFWFETMKSATQHTFLPTSLFLSLPRSLQIVLAKVNNIAIIFWLPTHTVVQEHIQRGKLTRTATLLTCVFESSNFCIASYLRHTFIQDIKLHVDAPARSRIFGFVNSLFSVSHMYGMRVYASLKSQIEWKYGKIYNI